jgi:hypothetical protein
MPDEGDVVFICLLLEKRQRDENEERYLAKRNYKRIETNSKFLDLIVCDDSVQKYTVRIKPWLFEKYGAPLLDNSLDGKTWLLVRGKKFRGFQMIGAEKIKCLNDATLFQQNLDSSN